MPAYTPQPTDTRPPTPTPTPMLPWPAPLEEPPASKLGLHVQWNNSSEIMDFIRYMKPRVIKAVGDFGFCAEVKEESPSTVIVGRVETKQRLEGDPERAAQAFVARHLETYQVNPAIDYWEGINEPDIKGKMPWYAAFEAERVRVMARHGFKAAIGSFSAGVPEWEEFEQFLPAVRAAKQHGGILSLHEYDAPTLDRSMGAGLPGHPNHADRGALALRYRWWYEDFLKPRGLVVPLVISEVGVDGKISSRPGPEGQGWHDFQDYWAQQGLGGNPYLVYIRQLRWYDDQVRKDDYVIGWTLFTVGAMNEDWDSYDVTNMLRHIAHEIMVPSAQEGGGEAAQPSPSPSERDLVRVLASNGLGKVRKILTHFDSLVGRLHWD
ncbi:MAG: hypothetical protein U9R48_11220 [Chloroflexota bacterium]|nr:hypothetical protein [Chloroflexota bacterium]